MVINEHDIVAFEYFDERPEAEILRDPETYRSKSLNWMARHFRETYSKPYFKKYDKGCDEYYLGKTLIAEEYTEVMEAGDDPAHLLKELADLVYVCYQMASTFGFDLDEAMRRVHASNMSKLGDDGKPILRETDQKILKGPHYAPPELGDLV